MSNILCSLVGDGRLFSVNLDGIQTVHQLKEVTRVKRARLLGAFKACDLTLYKGEYDQSPNFGMCEREIKRLSENLHMCTELKDPQGQPSTILRNPSTGRECVILVQIPQGESIYCGGVVLMADVANATRPRPCAIGLPLASSIQYLHPAVSIDTTLTTESNPPSQGFSGNHPIHNPATVRQLLGAGYEVLREEEDPESGWVLLNPVRSSFISFNSQAFNTIHS